MSKHGGRQLRTENGSDSDASGGIGEHVVKDPRDRLIVALDTSDVNRVASLIDTLGQHVLIYKVGLELFTSCGFSAVELLQKKGKRVFLDLKLHDIPRTVERAAAAIARLGAFMTTAHCLAGKDVLQAARTGLEAGSGGSDNRPLLLAVTLLTSHGEDDLKEVFPGDWVLREKVIEMAGMARRAGADGIVCSPMEVRRVKENCREMVAVTPGVRIAQVKADDQRRVSSPSDAIENGADYLVVGRPIVAAADPVDAARKVLDQMGLKMGKV
jgi:orotidine-5'-phosphate decarboxylase